MCVSLCFVWNMLSYLGAMVGRLGGPFPRSGASRGQRATVGVGVHSPLPHSPRAAPASLRLHVILKVCKSRQRVSFCGTLLCADRGAGRPRPLKLSIYFRLGVGRHGLFIVACVCCPRWRRDGRRRGRRFPCQCFCAAKDGAERREL